MSREQQIRAKALEFALWAVPDDSDEEVEGTSIDDTLSIAAKFEGYISYGTLD